MDHAERGVAGVARGHDDAERHDVRELFELDIAALHLLPDRIGRFLAAVHFQHRHAMLLAEPAKLLTHFLDHVGALAAQEVQPGLDGFEGLGVQLREGQGLQLRLHRIHADAFGERRIDLHGLAGDALAARQLRDVEQRAHVVQPVGELDQQDADVLAHRQHELAEILRLLGAVRLQFQPRQLGDAVHQARDLGAERLGQGRAGGAGVLDDIVQQGGGDAGVVQPIAGQDIGDGQRMGDIGGAVVALLLAMRLGGEVIGGADQLRVHIRVVGADAADQRVDGHRRLAASQLAGWRRGGR